jgi:hypothetical protein
MSSMTRCWPAVAPVPAWPPAGRSCSRTTTCGPTGSPRAAKISFMNSLSMLTALDSTPAPT